MGDKSFGRRSSRYLCLVKICVINCLKLFVMNKIIYVTVLFLSAACSQNKVADTATTNADTSFNVDGKKVLVYTTADSTNYRLAATDTLSFADFDQPMETQPSIFIDPSHTFQTFFGIGGALTDAAAETFAKLPADRQKEILQAYYDNDKGIAYTIGRTNINSCDFSSDIYTYVKDGDKDLASFSVAHDEKYKLPLIKKAME